MEETLKTYREFLKDRIRKGIDFSRTDQSRGIAPPPLEKPARPGSQTIALVRPEDFQGIPPLPLTAAIARRESRRRYLASPLTLEELAYLLWATQGVRRRLDRGHALRTVPSAGCRHALETYLCVLHVQGLAQGLYRYLPLEHQLVLEHSDEALAARIVRAAFNQPSPGEAAVTFLWTAIPYRMEWRYGLASHKVIALDAGHVCQNLYLACEAVGAGTCAIAAYDQEAMDALLGLDGEEEFTIYLASVGKVAD
jgi:SagB-type dehydrogenase family enzyme